jgi:DNA polymerase-1
MVYTIGIQHDFDGIAEGFVESALRYFSEREVVQIDTETLGFDPYTASLLCLQIGDYDNQWVIHPDDVHHFKPLLEEKILIGHNLKFDLRFLYRQDIWPTKVWDTFLAESLITCGLKQAKRGLANVARDRIGVDLDKSVRANIQKEGLSKRVILYSADDVKYLERIRDEQIKELDRLDLQRALDIENQFVIVLAYIEFCGFKLDRNLWQDKMNNDLKSLEEKKAVLDKFILDNKIEEFISRQLDLFSSGISTNINWASPKQVISLFKKLKIPTQIVEKGEKKDSVDSRHIEKHAPEFPFVRQYLDYKEAEKIVSTYGQSLIDAINPITGRIHTNFKQVMDTGRISSGNKDEGLPNLQNIPSDKETRGCFVSEAGHKLGISDYSGQEQIILANKCLDKNILKFYDEGLSDMHAFVAKAMYPELADLTLEQIKKDHKEKRQEAKIAGFVVNYGGAATNIADQLNKTKEVGEAVFRAYFAAFPGLESYFNQAKQEGLRNGFILVSQESGRKAFIDGYETYIELNKKINKDFWDRWKVAKRQHEQGNDKNWPAMKEDISTFFKIKGAIERKSLNYPIQGTAAEITKISAIYFFNWIRENNLIMTVKMVNQVHDENIIEAPDPLIERATAALKECMERAGEIYCKRVPLKADPVISTKWEK